MDTFPSLVSEAFAPTGHTSSDKPPSQQTNRPNQNPKDRGQSGNKRPPKNKSWPNKRHKTDATPKDVRHDKDTTKSESTGIQMYAARRPFIIFVSNHGIELLARIGFRAIRARDTKLVQNLTELQLRYVLCIAYANRIVQTSIRNGYCIDIPSASVLNNAAKGIELPAFLAKYIECIGMVKNIAGAFLAPFSGGHDELFPHNHPYQISPEDILAEAGRQIPPNEWRIDYEWLESWNESTTRPSRLGMHFSKIDFTNTDGRPEMLVSTKYVVDQDDPFDQHNFIGVAPQQLSESEGQLAACYQFRDYALQEDWLPGVRQLLFGTFLTTEFQASKYLSDLITKNFTTKV